MKNNTDIEQKRPADISARIRELDARMANLDERIEKNKTDLERNNADLTVKIDELSKAAGRKRGSPKH